jgi:hypothetical protein
METEKAKGRKAGPRNSSRKQNTDLSFERCDKQPHFNKIAKEHGVQLDQPERHSGDEIRSLIMIPSIPVMLGTNNHG